MILNWVAQTLRVLCEIFPRKYFFSTTAAEWALMVWNRAQPVPRPRAPKAGHGSEGVRGRGHRRGTGPRQQRHSSALVDKNQPNFPDDFSFLRSIPTSGPCMLDWIQMRGSVGVHCGPHARGPGPRRCPMGRRRARPGAPVGHESTSVGPTVDSYGPPTWIQSSIHGPHREYF